MGAAGARRERAPGGAAQARGGARRRRGAAPRAAGAPRAGVVAQRHLSSGSAEPEPTQPLPAGCGAPSGRRPTTATSRPAAAARVSASLPSAHRGPRPYLPAEPNPTAVHSAAGLPCFFTHDAPSFGPLSQPHPPTNRPTNAPVLLHTCCLSYLCGPSTLRPALSCRALLPCTCLFPRIPDTHSPPEPPAPPASGHDCCRARLCGSSALQRSSVVGPCRLHFNAPKSRTEKGVGKKIGRAGFRGGMYVSSIHASLALSACVVTCRRRRCCGSPGWRRWRRPQPRAASASTASRRRR